MHQVWHRPQSQKLLYGLVGRSVFPKPDGIMRKYKDYLLSHECRKAYRRAHVIVKYKKCPRVGDDASVKRHTVGDCTHRVFSDAEVDITPRILPGSEVLLAFEERLIGRCQICRASGER